MSSDFAGFVKIQGFSTAVYFKASVEPRYWEDATVNGVEEDDNNPTIPLRKGSLWEIIIDLRTGTILNWTIGTTAQIYYKVCDAGEYSLLDANFDEIIKYDGYVPSILDTDGTAYGDYIYIDIDENGVIPNFKIKLDEFTRRKMGMLEDD